MKSCSFFGHRNLILSEEEIEKLKKILIDLIENKNVRNFLFGSRSLFNGLCFSLLYKLKKKYPFLCLIAYDCAHEDSIAIDDKVKYDRMQVFQNIEYFDKKIKLNRVFSAGRLAYVVRNQEMIDNSDYCCFYFKEDYRPPKMKQSKRSILEVQPKSGTKLALDYARRKEKEIILI